MRDRAMQESQDVWDMKICIMTEDLKLTTLNGQKQDVTEKLNTRTQY